MNIDALKEINANHQELLEKSAKDNDIDPEATKGIALFVVKNGYDALSGKQKYIFDTAIRVLIENVSCSGYTHEFEDRSRHCDAILDDENLVDYYRTDSTYCESCQAQADADAHTKESFFKD